MSRSAPTVGAAADLPPVQPPSIRRSSARVRVDGAELDLHYRVAGSGPPLFALHPSPLHSAFMAPLMARLADRATVIAPDTPGFGDSDPLPDPIHDLGPCVRAMKALRRALGLDRVGVYGSATGAQIAVEWAKSEPQALSGIMLDNAAAFDETERRQILKGYLPDVTPSPDGSHLARAWLAAHDGTLFFPWQVPAAENRIARSLGSAAAMQVTALGYLRAGPGYAAIYRAAFRNERVGRLAQVSIPLVILRWEGSILARWTGRLDTRAWGANVTMAHCGASLEDRWTCLEHNLERILPADSVRAGDLCLESGRLRHVDSSFGQIRYWHPSGQPATRLLIPQPGATGASLPDSAQQPASVVVDLPGHGGSALPASLNFRHCVEAVRRVAAATGATARSVAGFGASDVLAQAAAVADAATVHAAAGPADFSGVPPDLASKRAGTHLFRAWHWLREQFLARNEPPPEPVRLTKMLIDLIDAQAAHRLVQEALENQHRTDRS
ncbi:MAG: alpha/beta hydrolase [Gammaproteobacteria bacterium]|nr:alpha/beta hydrolase [Gammaproteobacteria bacterium]MYH16201.1 alpha/beta hydrolase [Gammaproteobacteria bacterium]MYK81372.1 alpha/beta hydrolase [Gammaproteobacteria bacterium]